MKKFFMITPLQPIGKLNEGLYEAIGNKKLEYKKETRFPLIPVINGYAQEGEEIRVIAITPDTVPAHVHLQEFKAELDALKAEKGFICKGVENVSVTYAGDVNTQIEIFQKLLPYMEDNDMLYGCLTYGNKPMPIAELMGIQYAYRTLNNVTIECLVYGELDHSLNPAPMRIFDITALIQLDELVRVLAEKKVKDPVKVINMVLEMGGDEDGK